MVKEAVPDSDQVKTKEFAHDDLSQIKPLTGQFPETNDPFSRITLDDDILCDINWITEAHSRAYNRLNHCRSVIRRLQVELMNRDNRIAELEGRPTSEIIKMPFVDPPEQPNDLVILGERSLQRWVRFVITNMIMVFLGLFIAILMFIVF